MEKHIIPRRDVLRLGAILAALLALKKARSSFLGKAVETLTAQETVAVPEPQFINGVETYGHNEPLTNEQLIALRDHLNQKFLDGENKRPVNGMTATALVWAEEYNGEHAIHTETGHEDFQHFAKSQHEKMDEILKGQTNLAGGATLKRVIVMADDAEPSITPFNINDGESFMDSNAVIGLWFHRPYNPTLAAYYIFALMIDAGYLHEEGHYQLPGMPDFYAIDGYFDQEEYQVSFDTIKLLLKNIPRLQAIVGGDPKIELELIKALQQFSQQETENSTAVTDSALEGLPTEWLKYLQSSRDDDRNGMWTGGIDSLLLGRHEKALINRRYEKGWLHDRVKTYPETLWDFVSEFAPTHILKIADQENQNRWVAGPDETVEYKIYQTYDKDYASTRLKKKFTTEPTFAGKVIDGQFKLNQNPFEKGVERLEYIHENGVETRYMIPNTNALLMLRVEKRDASGTVIDQGWRYMDVNDFSVGYWENGASPNTCYELTMKFNLGNADVSPAKLKWGIEYEAARPENSISLPVVMGG